MKRVYEDTDETSTPHKIKNQTKIHTVAGTLLSREPFGRLHTGRFRRLVFFRFAGMYMRRRRLNLDMLGFDMVIARPGRARRCGPAGRRPL